MRESLGLRDARDGTVNTLLFAEIGRSDGGAIFQGNVKRNISGVLATPANCLAAAVADPNNPGFYTTGNLWPRGSRWNDAGGADTGFTTVLPPQRAELRSKQ